MTYDDDSDDFAPWTIVEANDKHITRVNVLETIGARLEKAMTLF